MPNRSLVLFAVDAGSPIVIEELCHDFLLAIEKSQHEPEMMASLMGCRELLPELHCEILALPAGSTYADAVQVIAIREAGRSHD